MLTHSTARVLDPGDLDAALALLDRDPVANAFVTSRVNIAGLDPWRLGGEMWGWYSGGRLHLAVLRGRQPRTDLRHPRGRAAPSPSGPAGPAAAARPSSARPSPPPTCGPGSNRTGARPARSAPTSR